MPAKKRVPKEKIISAAMDLLRESGISSVNIKNLAQRLGCSSQPIYLSFANIDELRTELVSESVKVFAEIMKQEGGSEQVCLYSTAYLKCAAREKELFKFLFMRQKAFSEIKGALDKITESSIKQLMNKYKIDWEEAHWFHDQLWMQAHGIASMIAADFCAWDMKKAENMLEECRKYLEKKYES